MSTPNRLKTHWQTMQKQILKKWDRLTLSDLALVDAEFDRLVALIKERYNGPVVTIKEAHIRSELLNMLREVEEFNPPQ